MAPSILLMHVCLLILRLAEAAAAARLLLDGQEQLELWGQLLLRVQAVGEVDAADAAVRVHLHPQCLDVVCACREEGRETGGQEHASVRQKGMWDALHAMGP